MLPFRSLTAEQHQISTMNYWGFQLVGNLIHHIARSERLNDPIFSIFPESQNEVKTAYMATGNGEGFGIFELRDPKTYVPETSFEDHRGRHLHVWVTDSDPDSLPGKMVQAGDKWIGSTVHPVRDVSAPVGFIKFQPLVRSNNLPIEFYKF